MKQLLNEAELERTAGVLAVILSTMQSVADPGDAPEGSIAKLMILDENMRGECSVLVKRCGDEWRFAGLQLVAPPEAFPTEDCDCPSCQAEKAKAEPVAPIPEAPDWFSKVGEAGAHD